MGLHRAGFEMVGVDLAPQPHYPFEFHQADALSFDVAGFDFIWASPPCQAFTAYRRRPHHVKPCRDLIAETRARLVSSGTPHAIENVPRAPLRNPVTLCGSMFGLDVRRHRLIETSFPLLGLTCQHHTQEPRFPQATNRSNLRRTVEVGVWRIPLTTQQRAMGIDWMTRAELSQAVPPAYSEFIARAFTTAHHTASSQASNQQRPTSRARHCAAHPSRSVTTGRGVG